MNVESITEIVCPNCGEVLTPMMLTCYPPIPVVECGNCGYRAQGQAPAIMREKFVLPDGWYVTNRGKSESHRKDQSQRVADVARAAQEVPGGTIVNPMARWGDKGRFEGRDVDTKVSANARKKIVFAPKRRKTSVTKKNKE
jgi:Zn ribbon nucleic-acid-binding protein